LRLAFSSRQLLVVLDDVWNLTDLAPLLIGGSMSRTVVTTRDLEVAFGASTPARSYRLTELDPPSALEVLRRLAPDAVQFYPGKAEDLCQRMGFMPLGLTLAGRLLALEQDVPGRMVRLLDELSERREARLALRQGERRLGADFQEASVQAILDLSVSRLPSVDQDRFAMLAALPADPASWDLEMAAAVWECSIEEAEDSVSLLLRRGLVERRRGAYWMHALLRDYAEELLYERFG
jgi:hypothetical protein